MVRFGAQTLISLMWICLTKGNLFLDRDMVPGTAACGVLTNVSNLCLYTATEYLPLGLLVGVMYYVTLVTSAILHRVYLREPMNNLKIISIILMSVGLLLMLQPWNSWLDPDMEFSSRESNLSASLSNFSMEVKVTEMIDKPGTDIVIGLMLVLIAGICISLHTFIMKLTLAKVSMATIAAWMGFLGVIQSGLFMFYLEDIYITSSIRQNLLLSVHAVTASVGYMLTSFSQQLIDPAPWAMISASTIVVDFTLQYTIMGYMRPGHRNSLEVIGGAMVVLFVFSFVFLDVRLKKDPDTDTEPFLSQFQEE